MSEIQVNTISEYTSANGVTIDSVLVKDGVAHSGLVKLASSTASSSSELVFDNFADKDTYSGYKIYFSYLKAATDNVELRGVFRTSAPADITGTYVGSSAYAFMSTSGAAVSDNQSQTDYFQMMPGVGNQNAETLSFVAETFLPNGTNGIAEINFLYRLKEQTNNLQAYYHFSRAIDTQTEVKGVRFYFSSGNIASGDVTIYGIKK